MKRLFDPFFAAYCMIWLTIKFLRNWNYIPELLNSYLTDVVAVPVVAHIALTITRCYLVKDHEYTYPLTYLLFIAAYITVVFEWIMPRFSAVYTRDMLDIACYFAGALFYYYIHMPFIRFRKPVF